MPHLIEGRAIAEKVLARLDTVDELRPTDVSQNEPRDDQDAGAHHDDPVAGDCAAQEELTTERTKQLNRMLKSNDNDACGWAIN